MLQSISVECTDLTGGNVIVGSAFVISASYSFANIITERSALNIESSFDVNFVRLLLSTLQFALLFLYRYIALHHMHIYKMVPTIVRERIQYRAYLQVPIFANSFHGSM